MSPSSLKWIAEVVEFDEEMANRNIQAVRPGMKVFKVSAKSGEGMNEYLEFLAEHRATRHSASAVANNHHSASAR
jgi:hydrogenase nickel incorporation protein HypB